MFENLFSSTVEGAKEIITNVPYHLRNEVSLKNLRASVKEA